MINDTLNYILQYLPFFGALFGNIFIAIIIIIVVKLTGKIKNKISNKLEYITAFTVGILLGIIFLGFLPELIEQYKDGTFIHFKIPIYILLGILLFYLLEIILHWHHCKDLSHTNNCDSNHIHEHKNGKMMFIGTFIHNAFHGIILFGAFNINLYFGIATTFAILLHSIPQNIVNYIMNHNNIKYSYYAAFGGVFGALLTLVFYSSLQSAHLFILGLISGSLLYIALTDIMPEFHSKNEVGARFKYLFFIILGIIIFGIYTSLVSML